MGGREENEKNPFGGDIPPCGDIPPPLRKKFEKLKKGEKEEKTSSGKT